MTPTDGLNIGSIILGVIGCIGVLGAAYITGRFAFKSNRKSASEAHEIAEQNVGIEERKTDLTILRATLEEVRKDVTELRLRADASEEKVKMIEDLNRVLNRQVHALTDYIWKLVSLLRRLGHDDKIPEPPDGISL